MSKPEHDKRKEDDIVNMDEFEEKLGDIIFDSTLTPLGVAAIFLKNSLTMYGSMLDADSMRFIVDFAMDNHPPSETGGTLKKITVH